MYVYDEKFRKNAFLWKCVFLTWPTSECGDSYVLVEGEGMLPETK